MAGALIFALFLYRTKSPSLRLALSRFLINLFVNVGLGSLWSYMLYSKGYLYYFAKSLVKNTLMLPIEIVLLALFFRMLIPYLEGKNWIVPQGGKSFLVVTPSSGQTMTNGKSVLTKIRKLAAKSNRALSGQLLFCL